MSDEPKKKGLSIKGKAKRQVVAPGTLEGAPRSIITQIPEDVKEVKEEEKPKTPRKPIVRDVPQGRSLVFFGTKATTPGLQQPVVQPKPVIKATPKDEVVGQTVVPKPKDAVAKPEEAVAKPEEAVAKPKKQVQIISEPTNVRLISPREEKPVEEEKKIDPAVLKLKEEFDYLMELYANESYEDIDISNMRDESKDEDEKEFYFYANEDILPIEEDFTDLNQQLSVLEFRDDGYLLDQTDPDAVLDDFNNLFDMFRDADKAQKAAKAKAAAATSVAKPKPKPVASSKELDALGNAILKEEGKLPGESEEEKYDDKYTVEKPVEGYTPINRRNFSHFIVEKFAAFQLPPLPNVIDPNACQTVLQSDRSQMYLYQQFVKEYLSWQTPYRGILVYHGLGSGKTCTSIAAAEALFATADKRIIVMTPFSLRQNFIGEITTCGFHHYRLKNYWNFYYLSDPAVRLFATSVLHIPDAHLAKVNKIWVPDFSKPSNYETLSPGQQTEIREQINAILVWDPAKGLKGRIWFISYNGITAKELLKIACQRPKDFDNAVIVIDEIHNLIRIMQGTIEPYLVDLGAKVKRKIAAEPITWERWKPALCPADWSIFESSPELKKKNYKRGYLFYRLLTQAQNSKIIGLSGTPLINFPEELGILANILHGYVHIVQGNIARPTLKKGGTDKDDDALVKKALNVISNNPFVDFYDVKKMEGSIQFRVTFLPEGIRKVPGKLGVERIDPSEPTVDFAGRLAFLESDLEGKGIPLLASKNQKAMKLSVVSQPLLPPIGSEFNNIFINQKDLVSVQNNILLIKRLTGLISYYKGSRDDLMPKITKDETVRVPMSAYQQTRYSEIRVEEIEIEEEKEKKKNQGGDVAGGRLAALYAEVYDIKNMKQSSNYRMASRQVCNFAFPADVNRPRPNNEEEQQKEAGQDVVDILDAAPTEGDDLGTTLEKEQKDMAKVEEEEEEIEKEEGEERENELAVKPNDDEEEEAVFDEASFRAEAEASGFTGEELEEYIAFEREEFEKAHPPKAKAGKTVLSAEQKKCRAITLPGETTYQQKIDRAKNCLRTVAKDKMKMGPNGLAQISPKFQKILENIAAAKGSSLVYSQFLQMEGIGIFSIAMEANGYEPIEIKYNWQTKQAFFNEATKKSLLKGPSPDPKTGIKQLRYITFTGAEESEVRKYALLLFNSRFSELPKELADVLSKGGWKNNDFGDLCRVFCITSAGAEGLSLKNVRAVHIMEPYWNDVRMAQVKGRAVRICSHAELPPAERTVDVYTYVSVFSQESQVARQGQWAIIETIRNRDSLAAPEAIVAKLPIPQGAIQYTLTSDERLWLISNRKKALIDNLQSIMKSAAVDCKLNQAENKDVKCTLFEKTGDFMYDPDFETDRQQSEVLQQASAKTVAPTTVGIKATPTTVGTKAATPTIKTAAVARTFFEATISGVKYGVEPIYSPQDKTKPLKYLLYDTKDSKYETPIGEIGAKESEKTKGTYVPSKATLQLYPKQ